MSTGIPSLDALLENNGFALGDWIALSGEPGTMKTVTSLKIVGEWLFHTPGNSAVIVSTETPAKSIKKQMIALGYDAEKVELLEHEYNQLTFIDAFSPPAKGGISTFPKSVIAAIKSALTKMGSKQREGHSLLVIDSMAPLWSHATVKSRDICQEIISSLKYEVDIAFITLQLAVGTGKSFGFGAEHLVDNLIHLWLLDEIGDQHVAFKILKARGQWHDGKFHYLEFDRNTKKIEVGKSFIIKGRFKSADEAMDSLQNTAMLEVQEVRNLIITKKMNAVIEAIGGKIDDKDKKTKFRREEAKQDEPSKDDEE